MLNYSSWLLLQAYSINRLTAVPSLMRAVLPTLKGRYEMRIPNSLKLLVLSGETLSLSLWEMLSKILPGTNILNLYGSTEVRITLFYLIGVTNSSWQVVSFNLTVNSDSIASLLRGSSFIKMFGRHSHVVGHLCITNKILRSILCWHEIESGFFT